VNALPPVPPTRLRRRPPTALAAAIGLALGTAPAFAADPPADTLEDIVVTANRREQNSLDVPYNISTVSGSALQDAGAVNLTDMSRLLPGVTIPDVGSRSNSSNSLITIRGLNVNDPVTSAYLPWGSVPTVSTYIDDVPLYIDLKLDDIQRIEVLRGPQGTLYGSGAVGGTVKVVHNAPDLTHFSAQASVDTSHTQHASDPSYSGNFVINVPLASTVGFRLSGGYDKVAGFIDARNATVFGPNQQPLLANPSDFLNSGLVSEPLSHIDDARDNHLRAALLWKAPAGIDVNVGFERQDNHSDGFSSQTAGYQYQTEALVPLQPEHRVVDLDSLTLTADAGFATITSSTSFSTNTVDNVYDESQFIVYFNSLTPALYGNYPRITSLFFTDSEDTAFTQEFRLASKPGTDWDYTLGAFFQHQAQDLFQRESIPGFAAWANTPGSGASVSTPTTPYANFGDFLTMYYGGTRPSDLSPVDTNFTYRRISGFTDRALFGELTRHLTSRWQVTGGARIFWQHFDQSLYSTIPYGGPVYSTLPYPANLTDHLGTTIANREQGFDNHLFKLNTSYEITTDMRAYATFSEGFRHGGINALPLGACIFCENPSIVPYKSDTVKNYEIGLKGTAGGWLRYSAAAYRIHWNDLQIQVFGQAGDPAVVNGKEARSQGLELELGARLGAGWSASLGYGLTDAYLTQDFSIVDVVNGVSTTLVSGVAGNRLPHVPRQTLTADLGYTHNLAPQLDVDAHVNAAYRSDIVTQLNSSVVGYQQLGGFTTINASTGLSIGNAWHTRLFVNNIANVAGITSAGALFRNYDDPRYHVQYPTRPRTIGVGLDYTFD
jgi:outer membrane receptor protein involved in Fe transport